MDIVFVYEVLLEKQVLVYFQVNLIQIIQVEEVDEDEMDFG